LVTEVDNLTPIFLRYSLNSSLSPGKIPLTTIVFPLNPFSISSEIRIVFVDVLVVSGLKSAGIDPSGVAAINGSNLLAS